MIVVEKKSDEELSLWYASRTNHEPIAVSTLWRWKEYGAKRILDGTPRRRRKISATMQEYENECGKLIYANYNGKIYHIFDM